MSTYVLPTFCRMRGCSFVMKSIIDLLIPGQTPGIKEQLVDLYGKPEILFFGPDEGTADVMDWAACMCHLHTSAFHCSHRVL